MCIRDRISIELQYESIKTERKIQNTIVEKAERDKIIGRLIRKQADSNTETLRQIETIKLIGVSDK